MLMNRDCLQSCTLTLWVLFKYCTVFNKISLYLTTGTSNKPSKSCRKNTVNTSARTTRMRETTIKGV